MQKPRRPRYWISLYLKGAAVGAAQIVPGVSGGTMALVLGIYEDLLASIGAVTGGPFLRALVRGRFGAAMGLIKGSYLAVLGLGIVSAVLFLAGLLGWLLDSYPSEVFAFFFGLVVASIVAVGRRVGRWSAVTLIMALVGTVIGVVVVGLTPTETPAGGLFLALSGALAVCALVLPGISGAFILVLLGHYDTALAAISTWNLRTLVPLVVGAVIGLLSVAKALSWLLAKAHGPTLALLTGFMLGSLRKLWPWQQAGTVGTPNVLPPTATAALVAIALGAGGALAVMAVEWTARKR